MNEDFIFDNLEKIFESIDFNHIYEMIDTVKYEIIFYDKYKEHTLENFEERLFEDENFLYSVPDKDLVSYMIHWAIVDSYMNKTVVTLFDIDFIYTDDLSFSIVDTTRLENKYNEHKKMIAEYENDLKNVLPLKNYKGNCSKEFCNKIVKLYIEREFDKIQLFDFPPLAHSFPTEKKCKKEFENFLKNPGSLSSKGSSDIIRFFHKSIIFANTEGALSPYDGWQQLKSNINIFTRFYSNRLRHSDFLKENIDYLVEGNIPIWCYGLGLSTSRYFPHVSYFKPKLAKYIVEKYLNKYNTIFDPFSGYSGRMLGAIAAGKKYIGQDLCHYNIDESKQIYDFLNKNFNNIPNINLSVADTEKTIGKYDCLFTCSPYNNKENWPGVNSVNYSCDKWIDICIKNFDCERYVFVTDENIIKYKEFVKEKIINASHFGKNEEFIVVIDKAQVNF